MRVIVYLLFFLTLSLSLEAKTLLQDSIGVEKRDGRLFIVHEIEEKETVYALSRRYNVSVDQIYQHNPGADQGVGIGQRLYVPWRKPEAQTWDVVHVVKEEETLYAISRQYKVSYEEIKQLNGLSDNNVSVGDRLKIKLSTAKVMSSATQDRKEEKVKKVQGKARICLLYTSDAADD